MRKQPKRPPSPLLRGADAPIEIHVKASEPVRWRRPVLTTIPKLSSSITLSTPTSSEGLWVARKQKEESSACLIRRSRSLQPDPARIKRGGRYAQTLARSRMSTSTQRVSSVRSEPRSLESAGNEAKRPEMSHFGRCSLVMFVAT